MKPKNNLTSLMRRFTISGYLFLGISTCYFLIHLEGLPEIVPGHIDFLGRVDSKYELFFLPLIGFFMMLLLGFMARRPHKLNYPCAITAFNAASKYYYGSSIIRHIQISSGVFFGTLTLAFSTKEIHGIIGAFGLFVTLLYIGYMSVAITYFLRHLLKDS